MKTGPNGWMTLATMAALSLPLSMANGARAAGTASANPGVIGDVTVAGVGCPNGTSQVTVSDDRTEISIALDSFSVAAGQDETFGRVTCMVAIPVVVPAGMSVGIVGGGYEGTATVPNAKGAKASLMRSYFISAGTGPTVTTSFDPGYNDAFSDRDDIVTWSACGKQTMIRENVSIVVSKPFELSSDVALSVQSMSLRLAWRQCP
jgi:hypothetical protein